MTPIEELEIEAAACGLSIGTTDMEGWYQIIEGEFCIYEHKSEYELGIFLLGYDACFNHKKIAGL